MTAIITAAVSMVPATIVSAPVLAVIASIIPALVAAVIPTIAVTFLVTRDILAVIPSVLHEVDALAAGIVFVAVLAPVFGVTWGYAQIDRRTVRRNPSDYHRLRINQ
ncbi:hypothetical protein SKTS_16410 [Sulfurimicrobium lacus]|uniref:Uncharacterized protein n=1 Tax=Sulfurimicrobium lacus TaxID=2715678 RepID=A0A6F8VDB6_9PROT|nr:hypothetical protein SKTS_16410 [Sulfurimicrobium lacus]